MFPHAFETTSMRHRATWILLPIFLGALGALWWSEYARIPTVAEKRRLLNRVLPELIDLKRSEVVRVEIDRPSLKQTIAMAKRGDGGWQIERPIDVSANRARVESLIENLVKLAKSPDSGTMNADPRTFGLNGPTIRIRIYSKTSTGPIATLDVGKTLRELRAVRAGGSEGIDMVPAESLAAVDLPLGEFRERGVLTFASAQVERIDVVDRDPERNMSLIRDEQVWRMTKPLKTRADGEKVEALIAELGVLETVEGAPGFVADDVKPSELLKYGLNPPRVTIAVTPFVNSRNPSVNVLLGDPLPGNNDQVYALQGGQDDVLLVDIKRLREALPKASALRSPEVLDFDPTKVGRVQVDIPGVGFTLVRKPNHWEQAEPSVQLAETAVVENLLKTLREFKVAAFLNASEVLDPKLASSVVRFRVWGSDSKSAPLADLKLGRHDSLRKTVYGQLAGDPTILAIPDSFLKVVPRSPLAYRSLEVVSLNPARVARLSVTRGGSRVSVVSPGSNQQAVHWKMTEPVKANTDETAITTVITLLSNLKAATWESESLDRPEKYGLHSPLVELEWELESPGSAAENGRLRIGAQKPGSGLFYAALDGKAGVFTVSPFELAIFSKEFHDHAITDFRLNDLRRAVFEWPGSRLVVDARNDEVSKSRWRVAEFHGKSPIPSESIEAMLEELSHLQTVRYLQYKGPIPESSGLLKPKLTIQLYVQSRTRLRNIVLKVGGPTGEASLLATTAPEAEGPTFLISGTDLWREWLKRWEAGDEWPEDVFAR